MICRVKKLNINNQPLKERKNENKHNDMCSYGFL